MPFVLETLKSYFHIFNVIVYSQAISFFEPSVVDPDLMGSLDPDPDPGVQK
jgi:hypothetical protein